MLVSSFKIKLEFGLLEPVIQLQESEFELEFDLELEVMAELESKYLELVVAVLLV